jgi:hypothetical protein
MATYASLTAEQKDATQSLVNAIRGATIAFAALAKQGQVVSAAWNGGLSDVVNSLDANEVIPNTSGYAGAQGVSKADVTNFAGYLIDLSDAMNDTGGGGYNTAFHQALRVKFSGINAAVNA